MLGQKMFTGPCLCRALFKSWIGSSSQNFYAQGARDSHQANDGGRVWDLFVQEYADIAYR